MRRYRGLIVECGIVLLLMTMAALTIALVVAAREASAQTTEPMPNVPLLQTGGVYPMSCVPTPPMDDVVKACFVRTDVTPIVELGCTDAGPNQPGHMDLTLAVNVDELAEVRCYVVSSYGVPSDYSTNAGTVDFTKPGRPFVPSTP